MEGTGEEVGAAVGDGDGAVAAAAVGVAAGEGLGFPEFGWAGVGPGGGEFGALGGDAGAAGSAPLGPVVGVGWGGLIGARWWGQKGQEEEERDDTHGRSFGMLV